MFENGTSQGNITKLLLLFNTMIDESLNTLLSVTGVHCHDQKGK